MWTVNGITNNGAYYDLQVTSQVANGILTDTNRYTISIVNNGTTGAAGSSGTSGTRGTA